MVFEVADFQPNQQKRDLIRSVNWWVRVSSGLAGAFGGAILLWFRATGQLPPEEYSYTRIILHSFAIGVAMPTALVLAFHISIMPSMKVWFERLGALILFVVMPAVFALGFVQWLMSP